LGFAGDLESNVRALANASITEFTPGEINGRLFLSFCAVGIDPLAILPRDPRQPINPDAIVYPAPRRHDVSISTRGRTVVPNTPCVIVSNNASQIRAFGLRDAPDPDPGLLNVYVARRSTGSSFVDKLLRRESGPPHFQPMTLPDLRIDSSQNKVILCIDGEMLQAKTPLHIRARSTPIRVLIPPRV